MEDSIAQPLLQRVAMLVLALACTACTTLGARDRNSTAAIAVQARSQDNTCPSPQCTRASPLLALGKRAINASTKESPRHYALILDDGQDALLARLDLIRGARRSIELQTYIFDEDDIGTLMLSELRAAARRGVKVRLLVDQLAAFKQVRTIAALATDHRNLELRLYNPIRNRGRARKRDIAASLLCCFRQTNQRMHAKVLAVDSMVVVTGGRNYQNDYFDWSDDHNFRDRDVLVAGPEAINVLTSFDRLWNSPRSIPAERLDDVGTFVRQHGVPVMATARYMHPDRVAATIAAADDAQRMQVKFADQAFPVTGVSFVTDGPGKHDPDLDRHAISGVWQRWVKLMASARNEVILQTPYLVLSDEARMRIADARARHAGPVVLVSTSSLASTDAFVVYALTHKYKHEYVDRLGFRIYEFRPRPANAPATFRGRRLLHAKSMVVDRRIGMVGTHNFDARSDHYNIESMLVIDDPRFAMRLADSIGRDLRPENAWVLAPRRLADGNTPAAVRTRLGATDYQFHASGDCNDALPMTDPRFTHCYRTVGEFPETGRGLRLLTRLLTLFGGALVPIL